MFRTLVVSTGLALLANAASPEVQRVVVLGDSLSEGYGVAREEAFPSLLEEALKAKHPGIQVINAGIGGSTSASGPSRLKWHLKSPPKILLLALGGNDGLRGVKLAETERNLEAVLREAKSHHVQVLLAGMKLPPSYGATYVKDFENMYIKLARVHHVPLIPFLLEGVGGNPSLNQTDGIHPNAQGHAIIARTVLKYLEPLL